MELSMENIKSAMQDVVKSIDEKLAATSAEQAQKLTAEKAALETRIKHLEDSIKLKDLTIAQGEEKQKFSITKAIGGIYNQSKGLGNAWHNAGFEKECIDAYMKQKIASADNGSNAGYLIPPVYMMNEFIPKLDAKTPLLSSKFGVTRINNIVGGDLVIPKGETSLEAYHIGENAIATESNLSVGQLKLSEKRIGARTKISKTLIKNSSNFADQLITDELAKAMAQKQHRMFIYGSGNQFEPKGILNYNGIHTLASATNGARFKIDDIEEMKAHLAEADALEDDAKLGIIIRPIVLSGLKRERVDNYAGQAVGTGQPIGGMDILLSEAQLSAYTGVNFGTTTHLLANLTCGTSTTCSSVILGDFSQVLVGTWADMEIMVSDVAANALFENAVWVVANMGYDIALRREGSFVVKNDAETLSSKW